MVRAAYLYVSKLYVFLDMAALCNIFHDELVIHFLLEVYTSKQKVLTFLEEHVILPLALIILGFTACAIKLLMNKMSSSN